MATPGRGTGRREISYPNQWRVIRITRGMTQRDVARVLGHLNVNYYKLIERGLRFPRPRILFVLLVLFRVSLRQAYPRLTSNAEDQVQQALQKRRRGRSGDSVS